MQVIVDDQGRVEIPRILRDRLHLTPGALVEVEPSEGGVQVTPIAGKSDFVTGYTTIDRKGSLVTLRSSEPLNADEVNRIIDSGRDQRSGRIVDEGAGLP